MPTDKTVQVSFRCDPDLRQRLKVAAAERGTTVNALIVAAIEASGWLWDAGVKR